MYAGKRCNSKSNLTKRYKLDRVASVDNRPPLDKKFGPKQMWRESYHIFNGLFLHIHLFNLILKSGITFCYFSFVKIFYIRGISEVLRMQPFSVMYYLEQQCRAGSRKCLKLLREGFKKQNMSFYPHLVDKGGHQVWHQFRNLWAQVEHWRTLGLSLTP
jgi:hypothetical protein